MSGVCRNRSGEPTGPKAATSHTHSSFDCYSETAGQTYYLYGVSVCGCHSVISRPGWLGISLEISLCFKHGRRRDVLHLEVARGATCCPRRSFSTQITALSPDL